MADYTLLKRNNRFASLPRRPADGTAKSMPVATGDHGIKLHPWRQTLPCLHEVSWMFETGFDFLGRELSPCGSRIPTVSSKAECARIRATLDRSRASIGFEGVIGIKECNLAAAPGSCQLRIQFIPARGTGRQKTKNFGICLRETEKSADKKLIFGFPLKIRYRAKEHVGLDFLARVKTADLVGGAKCRSDKSVCRAQIAADAGAGQSAHLKGHEIILQTDVVAIKMHLHVVRTLQFGLQESEKNHRYTFGMEGN